MDFTTPIVKPRWKAVGAARHFAEKDERSVNGSLKDQLRVDRGRNEPIREWSRFRQWNGCTPKPFTPGTNVFGIRP